MMCEIERSGVFLGLLFAVWKVRNGASDRACTMHAPCEARAMLENMSTRDLADCVEWYWTTDTHPAPRSSLCRSRSGDDM